jgi:hypothetical protein
MAVILQLQLVVEAAVVLHKVEKVEMVQALHLQALQPV